MPLRLATVSFSGKNLTSLVSLGSYTASGDQYVQVEFNLTGLNGAAATITGVLRRKSGGGSTVKEIYFSEGKRVAADTVYGGTFKPIFLANGEVAEVLVQSTNGSDTNASGSLEVVSAAALSTDEHQQIARSIHPSATVWYVATTGNDSNDGKTWSTAFLTGAAAASAAANGDTILFGPGTFSGQIDLSSKVGIRVQGGRGTILTHTASVVLLGTECELADVRVHKTGTVSGTGISASSVDRVRVVRCRVTSTGPAMSLAIVNDFMLENSIFRGVSRGGTFDRSNGIALRCQFIQSGGTAAASYGLAIGGPGGHAPPSHYPGVLVCQCLIYSYVDSADSSHWNIGVGIEAGIRATLFGCQVYAHAGAADFTNDPEFHQAQWVLVGVYGSERQRGHIIACGVHTAVSTDRENGQGQDFSVDADGGPEDYDRGDLIVAASAFNPNKVWEQIDHPDNNGIHGNRVRIMIDPDEDGRVSLKDGAITPAAIATGAIDADALAADAAAEIADAVWDEAIAGHTTAGSTGAKLNSL